MKKAPSGIHPSYTCAEFPTDLTIYAFPRVPQRMVHSGSRTTSPGPRNQNFQKMKKRLPGIHQSSICAKFQTFDYLCLPWSTLKVLVPFRVQNWALPAQNLKFSKTKKNTPRDSPKLYAYQIFHKNCQICQIFFLPKFLPLRYIEPTNDIRMKRMLNEEQLDRMLNDTLAIESPFYDEKLILFRLNSYFVLEIFQTFF